MAEPLTPRTKPSTGMRVIGALKLGSGLLLAAAGFGIFRLLDSDLGEVAQRMVSHLHLDPENRFVTGSMFWLAGIDRHHLQAIDAGTFFYALLHLIEGSGLWMGYHWAAYMVILSTSALLPLEAYELAHKVNGVRLLVLAVNLAILAYVIWRLLRERKARLVAQRLLSDIAQKP